MSFTHFPLKQELVSCHKMAENINTRNKMVFQVSFSLLWFHLCLSVTPRVLKHIRYRKTWHHPLG